MDMMQYEEEYHAVPAAVLQQMQKTIVLYIEERSFYLRSLRLIAIYRMCHSGPSPLLWGCKRNRAGLMVLTSTLHSARRLAQMD